MMRGLIAAATLVMLGAGCSLLRPLDGFTDEPVPTPDGDGPVEPGTQPADATGAKSDTVGNAYDERGQGGDAGPLGARVDASLGADGSADARNGGDVDASPRPTHYLYVIGGSFGADLFQDDVYFAPILGDGSLGEWDVTTALPQGTRNHAAVVYGNYLCVIGGEYAFGVHSPDVHVAEILPNGRLSPWQSVRGALGAPRRDHAAAVSGNRLYVSGGFDGQFPISSVLRADLSATSVGTFSRVATLPDGTRLHASSAVNGNLFAIGGIVGGSATTGQYVADVYSLAVGPTGQLGPLARQTSLSSTLGYHRMVSVDETLYVLGGLANGGSRETSTVYSTTASPDGGVSRWTTLASFSGTRWRHAATAAFGNIYLVGGRTSGDSFLRDVQIGAIQPDRTIVWRASKPFPRVIASHAVLAH